MPLESLQFCARRDIPERDEVVITTAGESLSVRTERDGVDLNRMFFECPQLPARRDIPQLNCAIRISTGENLSVRTKREPALALPESRQLRARRDIPQLDSPVITGKSFPIGTKGDGRD